MPFAGFKDFGACVSAQRRKGKSPESARKICGALQAKAEGGPRNAAQLPEEVRPHYNRSLKTLDYLKQQGVLDENEQYDTSLDNQQSQNTMSFYSDPESYPDKITRIMDEYGITEAEAKEIVGEIIQNEMKEIDRREYEVLKQVQIEKARADMMTQQDGKPSDQSDQQSEQEQESEQNENVGDPGSSTQQQ